VKWLVATIACAAVGSASAGPLTDAIARHGADDVAALRGKLPDPQARCALGAVFAKRGDKIRAALFFDGCESVKLDADVADIVAHERARVDRELEASQLSRMTIDSDPPGLAVVTDALPGEPLVTPATVWMTAGTHTVASADHSMKVDVAAHASGPIIFDRGITRVVKQKQSTQVDFVDDTVSDTTAPPSPDQKHPSLLPCRYSGCDTHSGETIDDPFEVKPKRLPIEPPMLSLGLRAGASDAFHAGGSGLAPSVAIEGRMRAGELPHVGPGFVDARLDWSSAFETFGASVHYGAVVFAPRAAWLSALVGVRGVMRTSGSIDAMAVERAGIGYTAALELALRALPVTVGVRYDEDLTDIVPGVRERAVIVELGGELRAGLRY
jgi:hypothetical protein